MSSFSFLPWVRQSLALASDPGPARRALTLHVALAVDDDVAPTDAVDVAAQLYGPGDVVGLTPQAILKTLPPAGEQRYSPGLLAGLEFYEEDLPWRYSPAIPDTDAPNRLAPWCCVIVLREDEFTRQEQGAAPLPVLCIEHPNVVFPNPRDSVRAVPLWAWAHVQATDELSSAGDVADFLTQALPQNPDRALARVLCPRRLEENTGYHAFLVPVYEAGRRAGLGLTPGATADQVAWLGEGSAGTPLTAPLLYPVYYQWEFRTGPASDFESLARQLRPDEATVAGAVAVDVATPLGAADPDQTVRRHTLTLPSALQPLNAPATAAHAAVARSLYAELLPAVAPPPVDAGSAYRRPVLTPPVYGSTYTAAAAPLADPASAPPATWQAQANLDVRYRAVAGLGAQLVAEHQEELVQQAWAQVRDVLVANTKLRGMQSGLQATDALRRTHLPVSGGDLFSGVNRAAIVAPEEPTLANYGVHLAGLALGRLRAAPGGLTLAETVRRSTFPQALLSPTFRRLAKPFGPYQVAQAGRPVRPTQKPQTDTVTHLTEPGTSLAQRDQLFNLVIDGSVSAAPPKPAQALIHQFNEAVVDQVLASNTDPAFIATPTGSLPSNSEYWTNYLNAYNTFRAVQFTPVPVVKEVFDLPALAALKARLIAGTDPAPVFLARANRALRFTPQYGSYTSLDNLVGQQRAVGGGGGTNPQPALPAIQPVMAYPVFKQALGELLRRKRPDLFIPGLADVGDNTVRLYEPNQAFVEALLVGANHALGGELLWRGFPTDLRGTYFQQFWDSSEYRSVLLATTNPDTAERSTRDITPLHEWATADALGTHSPGSDRVMLVVRAELLRRYPTAVVRAQAAQANPDSDVDTPYTWIPNPDSMVYPTSRVDVGQDIVLFEFPIASATAIGDPGAGEKGYFFVFLERPGEMQFGLDLRPSVGPPSTWNELAWDYTQTLPGEHLGINPAGIPAITDNSSFTNITTSAELAYALFQQPFAAAIHARELLA